MISLREYFYLIFALYFERKYNLRSELIIVFKLSKHEWMKRYPNIKPILSCTYRSVECQDAIFKIGRSSEGNIVTYARGGESPHNYKPSFAFDVAFWNLSQRKLEWNEDFFLAFNEVVKQFDRKKSIQWGGYFSNLKDLGHFEINNWKKLNQINDN